MEGMEGPEGMGGIRKSWPKFKKVTNLQFSWSNFSGFWSAEPCQLISKILPYLPQVSVVHKVTLSGISYDKLHKLETGALDTTFSWWEAIEEEMEGLFEHVYPSKKLDRYQVNKKNIWFGPFKLLSQKIFRA